MSLCCIGTRKVAVLLAISCPRLSCTSSVTTRGRSKIERGGLIVALSPVFEIVLLGTDGLAIPPPGFPGSMGARGLVSRSGSCGTLIEGASGALGTYTGAGSSGTGPHL